MKQQDLNVNIALEIIKKKISNFDNRKVQIFDDGWDFVVIRELSEYVKTHLLKNRPTSR